MKAKMSLSYELVLLILLLISGCTDASTSDNGGSTTEPNNLLEIKDAATLYKRLTGIDITKNTAPLIVVDANGNQTTISDSNMTSTSRARGADSTNLGWHPLKKDVTMFAPSAELVTNFIELDENSNWVSRSSFFEDKAQGYGEVPLTLPGDGSIDGSIFRQVEMAKGDFDGDGIEEIVSLYCLFSQVGTELVVKYYYRIFNGKWSELKEMQTSFMNPTFDKYQTWIYAYDLDCDGIDEIIFPSKCIESTDSYTFDIQVFKVDDSTMSLVTKLNCTINEKLNQDPAFGCNMAAGDIDNDGYIELVTMQKKILYIWEYKNESLTLQASPQLDIIDSMNGFCWTYIGDFDRNGLCEICAYPCVVHTTTPYIEHTAYIINSKLTLQPFTVPSSNGYIPIMADFNLDTRDEIVTPSAMISFNSDNTITKESISGIEYMKKATTGDVDGDGRPEILCNTDPQGRVYVAFGMNSSGRWVQKHTYPDISDRCLIFANIDDDSLRVQYAGHDLKYSEPIPLYALAGAPYYSEIAANDEYGYSPDDWSTSVSKNTSYTDEDANSLGFSVGVSFGFKTNHFFVESETEVNVKASFNHQWTNSMSVGEEITFETGGAGDDYLVFTAIPSDVFNYRVEALPTIHPTDGNKVGDIITIVIPRSTDTFLTPVSYYNRNNGELPDIDVFTHTAGDPFSYPTESKAKEIVDKYSSVNICTFDDNAGQSWKSYDIDKGVDKIVNKKSSEIAYFSGAKTVAKYDHTTKVGSNPTTGLSCEITKENGRSITAGGEVTVSQEVAAGIGSVNATAGVELGLSYEHEWTSNIAKGINFGGTVGNVPIAWYNANPKKLYKQGMFVYPAQKIIFYDDTSTNDAYKDKAKQQVFWVIDYFVEAVE